MTFKTLSAGAGLALGLILSTQALATPTPSGNLVSDGGFNAPSGGSSFTTYGDSSSFGPWNVSGSVDLVGGYWQAPQPGQGSVDLDGFFQTGSIEQDFDAPTSGLYTLTFDLSGNPDGGAGVKTVEVNVTPQRVADPSETLTYMTGPNSESNMNYTPESFTFSLPGGPTTLQFSSLDPAGSAYGPVIGNISLTSAVPEPSVWLMMLGGLGVVGGLLRVSQARRREQEVCGSLAA